MVSHHYKFIFIHVPKTGGTSIAKALRFFGLIGTGHKTLDRIKREHNLSHSQITNYFKFAVIRNPWDIVVSNYFYIRQVKSYWHSSDKTTKYGLHPDYETVSKMSFEEFVIALCSVKIKSKNTRLLQTYWVPKNINFLIRYEALQKQFDEVCGKIGLPEIKIPQLNASQHKNYKHYYNNKTKNLVCKYYKKDLERFRYEFD